MSDIEFQHCDIKLKDCPFCGSDAIGWEYDPDRWREPRYWVVCGECDATSAPMPFMMDAALRWNMRYRPTGLFERSRKRGRL